MAILMLGESLVLDGDVEKGKETAKEAQDLFASIDDHEGMDKAEKTLQQIQEILGAPVTPAAPRQTPTKEAESVSAVVQKPALSRAKAIEMVLNVAKEAIGEDENVTLDDPLMDIGLDSLAAVSFANTLSRESGIKLPQSTLVFDFPNLNLIADFLVEQTS